MALGVQFGTKFGTNTNPKTDTEATTVLPAATAGTVAVKVITLGGDATLSDGFTYLKAPTISKVDPPRAKLAGGDLVKVTGSGFADGEMQVKLAEKAVTDLKVKNATELSFKTPKGEKAGLADLEISRSGAGKAKTKFGYAPAPTISKVEPNKGPEGGGIQITVTGTGFKEGGDIPTYDNGDPLVTFEAGDNGNLLSDTPLDGE